MAVTVLDSIEALRATVAGWRREGARIGLVPTMGALHEGHLELVRRARERAERVVTTIFINPTQFAPQEDFTLYPRTIDEDLRQLDSLCDAVFAPPVDVMYPPGAATAVVLDGPATVGLEDGARPHHFRGVATICAKLFIQATPDVAMFGEKDFQQVKVVTRMARDLDLPLAIVPVATIREADGLALSSRNRYLTPAERAVAPLLHETLQEGAARIRAGDPIGAVEAKAALRLTEAGFTVDYVAARDAETLEAPDGRGRPLRLLVAAQIGATRLIDNIAV